LNIWPTPRVVRPGTIERRFGRFAKAAATQMTQYVELPKSVLKPLLAKEPGLGQAIQATLGIDLASQLRAAWSTGRSD